MKIVCISDTHNAHRELTGLLPEGDMIIHAGDISLRGSVAEIQDFVDWFCSLPYKHKIFIAGNHDFALEQTKQLIKIPTNIIYLENQETIVDGLLIWGSPVTTPFYDWAFMWLPERRRELYKTIPANCDIIISHGPAFSILDQTKRGENVGCPILKTRIDEVKPKLVLCGHIHEGYGTLIQNNTKFVNASIMTYRYDPWNLPIMVEI